VHLIANQEYPKALHKPTDHEIHIPLCLKHLSEKEGSALVWRGLWQRPTPRRHFLHSPEFLSGEQKESGAESENSETTAPELPAKPFGKGGVTGEKEDYENYSAESD
jgi:hypothetical protein